MVTRGQLRRLQLTRQQYQAASTKSESSQSSQGSTSSSARSSFGDHFRQADTRPQASYSSGDHCHRHAKPDARPYETVVSTYRRRKPH